MLEKFTELFTKSKPLVWPQEELKQTSQDTEIDPENKEQTSPDIQKDNTKTIKFFKEIKESPGTRLLSKIEPLFAKSANMNNIAGTSSLKTNIQLPFEESEIQAIPKVLTLEKYIQLVNQINKFSSTKDKAAYQSWFQNLSTTDKIVIYLFPHFQQQDKQEKINWFSVCTNITNTLQTDAKVVHRVVYEVQLYRTIYFNLRMILQKIPEHKSVVYPQVVVLLDQQSNTKEKLASLKIVLLCVEKDRQENIYQGISNLMLLIEPIHNVAQPT